MALVIKLLKAGPTNSATNTQLYSVSSPALGAIVDNVRLVNTGGVPVTVSVFFKASGSPSQVRILDRDLVVGTGSSVVVKPELTLATGDAIEATTSVPMDCVVSGMERL
jgi:hypothetical protein